MTNFHSFTLGTFTCTTLLDFARERTPRDTFPRIDPVELQKEIDAGGYDLALDNPMPLHGVVLLVETGQNRVLIDAGLPSEMGGRLVQSLADAGHQPSDIDTLIVTHGDYDHIGGLGNFPDSQIVLPTHAYQLWTENTEGMVEEFMKLMRDGMTAEEAESQAAGRRAYGDVLIELNRQQRLTLVESGREVLPGIRLIDAPGHRRDHVAVEVVSGGQTLLHVVDAFRHELQMKRHDFYCLFDSYPETLAETMVMLMDRAAEKDTLVFGSHFQFPALFRIKSVGEGYRLLDEQAA